MPDLSVWTREAHQFLRAKGLFIKLERLRCAIDDQVRCHCVVAIWNGFYFFCHKILSGFDLYYYRLLAVAGSRKLEPNSRFDSSPAESRQGSNGSVMASRGAGLPPRTGQTVAETPGRGPP